MAEGDKALESWLEEAMPEERVCVSIGGDGASGKISLSKARERGAAGTGGGVDGGPSIDDEATAVADEENSFGDAEGPTPTRALRSSASDDCPSYSANILNASAGLLAGATVVTAVIFALRAVAAGSGTMTSVFARLGEIPSLSEVALTPRSSSSSSCEIDLFLLSARSFMENIFAGAVRRDVWEAILAVEGCMADWREEPAARM